MVIVLIFVTLLTQARGDRIDQLKLLVAGFEQDRSAIRTAVRLIKSRQKGLVEQLLEQNTLRCAIVSHQKAFFVSKVLFPNTFLSH
jgi:hypothetical protein